MTMLSEEQNNDQITESKWLDTPPDLLEIIANHLHIRDFIRLKSICKDWHFDLHRYTPNEEQQWPMLWVTRKTHSPFRFLYSLTEKESIFNVNNPNFRRTIHTSACHGWLVTKSSEERYSLTNPFWPNSVYKLPESVKLNESSIAMSSPPTSPDSIVLAMSWNSPKIHFCRPGDEAWRCMSRELYEEKEGGYSHRQIVYHKGRFYAAILNFGLKVFVVDVANDELKKLQVPDTMITETAYHYYLYYLVVSRGEMLLVFQTYNPSNRQFDKFEIYRLEASAMSGWVRLEDLDGRVLFVGNRGSMCREGRDGEIENCVYYVPEVGPRVWYCYDLKTGSCRLGPDACAYEAMPIKCWFVPRWE